MVKECVTLHIGQAGCQIGLNCWELFCKEHGIQPNGTQSADEPKDDSYLSFFYKTPHEQHVPRAIFVDTDPTYKGEILQSKFGNLFHPESLIAYKQDCKNNFFEGRSMASIFKIQDDVMDRVRLAVDQCDNLQGFYVFHSIGGGTGSGIGAEILHELYAQFDKKVIFEPVVFPSNNFSSSIVEPYNAVLAAHYTRDIVDLTMVMDNEAMYRMCQKNLSVQNPDFDHVNRLIAQAISTSTTSLRYDCILNASLPEILTNLVPKHQYRYPILSLAPVRAAAKSSHDHFATQDIVTELFEERNVLCDCGQILKRNRYLAACVMLRGTERHAVDDDDIRAGGGSSSMTDPKGQTVGIGPIQVNKATRALHALMNPSGTHRKAINFVPWLESGGFKVGVVGEPPEIPEEGFMAKSPRQGVMMGNTTAVRQIFVRQYEKYCKLFYHKAYVWQFLEANGELDAFDEAREGFKQIICQYEELLRDCVEVENTNGAGVRLEGRTELLQSDAS